MSKVFYDHLIILEKLEVALSSQDLSGKEKEEIHQMIDESIHFHMMTKILDRLPRQHHKDFLDRFHKTPHHEDLLKFLKEKIINIEDLIRKEAEDLEKLFLKDIRSTKKYQSQASKKLKKRNLGTNNY